jgi:hypothetical protein
MGCCGDTVARNRGKPGSRGHKCRLCLIWQIIKGEGGPGGDPCVVVPGRVIDKPDPCIYDQFLLMQLNQPVTWDNPDVSIFLNGVEQYTYNLTVSTEYDVEITVHNSSRDRPATGTTVAVRWIEFGAGGQVRHPVATLTADVPTWPGTRVVSAKWTTPATPGHYCIEVELAHPDDGNPSNNRGWNNTQVYAAHSPAAVPIRIFNTQPGDCPPVREGGGPVLRPHRVFLGWGPLGAVLALLLQDKMAEHVPRSLAFLALLALGYVTLAVAGLFCESAAAWMKQRSSEQAGRRARADRMDCHLVHLEVDSYQFADSSGKDFDPATAFQEAPAIWSASVEPVSFSFLPGEAYRDVELRVQAPDGAGPPGHFNVNAWQGGVPSGGVSVEITRGG